MTEQKYSNLNRRYYHGAKTGRITKEDCFQNYFYLSTSFVYSAMYACDIDAFEGKVFEFRLKEGLNIFNAKSKQDIMKLRTFMKDIPTKKWYWEGLDNEDWSFLFEGEPCFMKNTFIDNIQKAGYDGFFIYEWTPSYKDKIRQRGKGSLSLDTSPAIGIFDLNKLRKVQEYKYEDYFKFKDFQKVFKKEFSSLINFAKKLDENDRGNLRTQVLYKAQDDCSFITEEDLDYIIENLDSLETKQVDLYKTGLFEDCLRNKVSIKTDSKFHHNYVLNENNRFKSYQSQEKLRSKGLDLEKLEEDRRRLLLKIKPKKHLK